LRKARQMAAIRRPQSTPGEKCGLGPRLVISKVDTGWKALPMTKENRNSEGDRTRRIAIGIAIGIAIEWPDSYGVHR